MDALLESGVLATSAEFGSAETASTTTVSAQFGEDVPQVKFLSFVQWCSDRRSACSCARMVFESTLPT